MQMHISLSYQCMYYGVYCSYAYYIGRWYYLKAKNLVHTIFTERYIDDIFPWPFIFESFCPI